MENLSVTLIQSALHWKNPGANLAMFEEKIWQIKGKTDLIILPEMFTTGFTMDAASLAEPMNLTTFKWLKGQAAQTGAVVTGSFIVKENGRFFNRLIWMQPDGNFEVYDKRHLFRMAEEHQTYTAGNKKIVPVLKGWRICPLVCYDLRFPVWSRNCATNNNSSAFDVTYDCLLYVANWPKARNHAWKTLLQARAIENLSYVIGVNRVGVDGKGIAYSGDSALIDPKGEALYTVADREDIKTIEMNGIELIAFRQKFPAFMDADAFELRN